MDFGGLHGLPIVTSNPLAADYHGAMRMAAFLLMLVLLSGAALSQPGKGRRGPEARPPSNMSQDERRRLRQDVDSARGNYQRRNMRPQDRMPPEEREKLRRDVQDANRDIGKR